MKQSKDILLEQYSPIISNVDSNNLIDGTFRLDGQYYVLFDEVENSITTNSFLDLNDCCLEIYEVPPFKHIYISEGVPFYTSSGLFENELMPSSYLTPIMPNIDKYRIRKGQILMARSGNVDSGILGQILIAGDMLDKTTTSDHVIRFTVDESKINRGYLAAFLMSDFCKGQLLKNAAGAVIPAIRPDSIRGLQIPIIDEDIQIIIGQKNINAVEKREEAIAKIIKARSLVLQYNNLPPLSNIKPETLDEDGEVEIRMTGFDEFTKDYRLDAHFYNPMAKLVLENIKAYSKDYSELGDGIADRVFYLNRFTRTFVEKGFGIPYMAGKDIIKIRPTDIAYLSYSETSGLEDYKLKTGWILMTCSGTLARTCYIYKNYEDSVATHDLIRIITSENYDSGYLYAFLSTDYGYQQAIKFKHGAVIDHLTPEQIEQMIVPLPSEKQQKEIGDLVRKAYELRAEAIKLEDEAQELLTQALTQA